ncbi:hypothetical protein, partial [Kitasatospora cinereorecta]|uniref:hypothetical protein n=1 Tax=Kitasatospora cinereorecta TaxID=285560 RepID=UPI0031F93434
GGGPGRTARGGLRARRGRPGRAAAGGDTTEVVRGDVTQIVTLDATIAPLPLLTVGAAGSGPVRHADLAAGTAVRAGQELFRTGSAAATAPVGATLTRWLVPDGAEVAAGVPVAELSYPGFGATAVLPPEAAYRILGGTLTARALITSGPGPFDCPIVQAPARAGGDQAQPAGAPGGGAAVVCAVPADVRVFDGLTGTVAVRSAEATGVLLLPKAAVAGSAQRGEVTVVAPDGARQVREVGLGISDGSRVEITSGLAEHDRVTGTAPALTARLP